VATKYTKSVDAIKLFKDGDSKKVNELAKIIFSAIVANRDLIEAILEYRPSSMFNSLKKYLNYGRNYYTLRLPSYTNPYTSTPVGDVTPIVLAREKVLQTAILTSIQATLTSEQIAIHQNYIDTLSIKVHFYQLSPPIASIIGAEYCMNRFGLYDYTTKISVNHPTKKYVRSESIGTIYNRVTGNTEDLDGDIYILIDDLVPDYGGNSDHEARGISHSAEYYYVEPRVIADKIYDKDYLHAIYSINSETTIGELQPNANNYIRYFSYNTAKTNEGVIPPIVLERVSSDYYPVVPVRLNKKFVNKINPEPDFVKTGKKLLNKISISLDEVTENISSSPDVEHIEDAFIHAGIHIQSQNKYSIIYLIEYFKWLRTTVKNPNHLIPNIIFNKETGEIETIPASTYTHSYLEHIVTEGDYGTVLSIPEYTYRSAVQGNIGKPIGEGTNEILYYKYNRNGGKITGSTQINAKDYDSRPNALFVNFSNLRLRRQLTETTYEELLLVRMLIRTQHNWGADRGSFTDNINTTPFYTILAGGYPSPTGITARLAPKTNKAFIIPLNDFVLRKLTSQARSEVAYNSISLTFYITVTTTTSWWKSLIKSFLVIILSLINVVLPGLGSTIIATTVLGEAVKGIIEITVKGEKARIAITAAISILFSLVTGLSNIAVDLIKIISQVSLMVLGIVSNLISAITSSAILGINKDLQSFLEESKELQDELDKQIDLLGDNSFDPLMIGKLFTNFYEDPSEFFNRSLNTNPGIEWLESQHTYVEDSLALPELTPEKAYNISLKSDI
jgi:hypothetical protein